MLYTVVSNSAILRHFKKIDVFKLDMGSNYFGPAVELKDNKRAKLKIKDEFIKKYESITNKLIHKYGEIGSIKFYEDLTLNNNEFHIYTSKGDIFELDMSPDDFARNPKEYLAEIIELIETGKAETDDQIRERKELEERKNKIYTTMPADIERPDISLPKEQYLEEMVKYRKKLNEQYEQ